MMFFSKVVKIIITNNRIDNFYNHTNNMPNILILPMHKANAIDNKNLTKLGLKYDPII